MNPYQPPDNTLISFSGGRTSGLMLHKFVEAHGGTLPDNIKVVFANTGKERNETLDFVNDCAMHFGVPIVWLEFVAHEEPAQRWQQVTYETAARDGKPFADLIAMRGYLPNPTMRFCTSDLKIKPITAYCRQVLGWQDWTMALGLRADEPRRVAKLQNGRDRFDKCAPLAIDGISKQDVGEFWQRQDFDLRLPNHNGTTDHGNCDLCFLKAEQKRITLIAENPDFADWWVAQEASCNDTFRRDSPSYRQLKDFAVTQTDFIGFVRDDKADCFCSD